MNILASIKLKISLFVPEMPQHATNFILTIANYYFLKKTRLEADK